MGSRFTSRTYTDLIKKYETIKISMDRKGRARDNIVIERFFRSYKWERLYHINSETVEEARELTEKCIKHYNNKRQHQSLGYEIPASKY